VLGTSAPWVMTSAWVSGTDTVDANLGRDATTSPTSPTRVDGQPAIEIDGAGSFAR